MIEHKLEDVRDSRVWDMRDLGYDVSRVEVRPVGDKQIMTMTIERPISVTEELHSKVAKLPDDSTTGVVASDDVLPQGGDGKQPEGSEPKEDSEEND